MTIPLAAQRYVATMCYSSRDDPHGDALRATHYFRGSVSHTLSTSHFLPDMDDDTYFLLRILTRAMTIKLCHATANTNCKNAELVYPVAYAIHCNLFRMSQASHYTFSAFRMNNTLHRTTTTQWFDYDTAPTGSSHSTQLATLQENYSLRQICTRRHIAMKRKSKASQTHRPCRSLQRRLVLLNQSLAQLVKQKQHSRFFSQSTLCPQRQHSQS